MRAGLELQIVESDDRIGLRPEADLAGVRERPVVRVDDLLSVPDNLEVIASGRDGQLLPDARSDLAAPAGELTPLAGDDVMEVDVVFESIGSRQVVVVRVPIPEDEAGALESEAIPGDQNSRNKSKDFS